MSDFQKYPFQTVYSNLHELYGLDMNEDTMETAALVAWNYIGNKDCRMYRAHIHPHPDGNGFWCADIPCNCLVIESITTGTEDFKNTSNKMDNVGTITSSIETQIENSKQQVSDIYQSGKLVPYRQVGETLYFTQPYHTLNILYKGLYADEDGLPYLTFKEVEAITAYCAYTHFHKKALATMDGSTFQLAQAEQSQWLKKCTQARTPEYLNQNEMNVILDAKTSWNRKSYGYSYKPVNG